MPKKKVDTKVELRADNKPPESSNPNEIRRNIPFTLEYRIAGEDDQERRDLVGHAAVFNKFFEFEIWGTTFREQIAPGAFTNALTKSDTRALFNHDANFPLARQSAGTLTMREDEIGLWMEATPSDTSFARDLETLIADGVIKEQSFAFTISREQWEEDIENDIVTRTILEIGELFDVSPVTFPAYKQTTVGLRDAYNIYREANGKEKFTDPNINTRDDVSEPTPNDGLVEPMPTDDELEPMPKSDGKRKKRQRKLKLRERTFKMRGMNK